MSASRGLSRDSQAESWPVWLTAIGPELSASLRTFDFVAQEYRDACREGFSYRHIVNQHLHAFTEARGKSPRGTVTPAQLAMLVSQNATPIRLIDTFAAAKRMAVLQLIDSTRSASQAGSLLTMFGLLRSLIEHVAHLDAFVTKMPLGEATPEFAKANQAIGPILDHCGKALYATRFDWLAVLKEDSGEFLEAKSREYKAQIDRLDRTARSILNALDGLEKSVPKIRLIYECLCEFAHPNVGMLLASVHSAQPAPDAHGVPWIEKHLKIGVPSLFVKELGPVLEVIFSRCAQCLGRSDQLLLQLQDQRARVLAMVQVVVRQLLENGQGVFDPYEPCPCGSGDKVKFCCGKKERQ